MPTIAAYRKLSKHRDQLDEYYESTDDVPSQAEFIRSLSTAKRAAKALEPISESLKVLKTQLAKTGQIEDVAAAFNMPVNLAHALDLDAIRDDGDRKAVRGKKVGELPLPLKSRRTNPNAPHP